VTTLNESHVEAAALDWFQGLGYEILHGPNIAPGEPAEERASFEDPILHERLRTAIALLNPQSSDAAREEAYRRVLRVAVPGLLNTNRACHKLFVEGVTVEVPAEGGGVRGELVRLADFDEPGRNNFVALNQLTLTNGGKNRRPDVVVYVNGLPLALLELKNAADEDTTIWSAFNQLETYRQDIPALFHFNEVLVVSDGLEARLGSISSGKERFLPWRTIDDETLAPSHLTQLEVLIRGLFDRSRFLDYVRHFVVFEDDDGKLTKKVAGYHQFHAVRRAVASTVESVRPQSDRRIGIIWHTQGSGKSLTMAMYAGAIIQNPEMRNPTVLVITDRNDLDEQLFGTFARCSDLLRQKPVQAENRAHLRELLTVGSGGVVFTTIQKFLPEEKGDSFPMLTDRRNVIVIADEAHRSQYGFKAKLSGGEIVYGFAQHLRDAVPNASFIGFSGTPIEREDKSTRAVFGEYISVYDIQRAVADGATVPIYYESRLAKLDLPDGQKPQIDEEFDEVTEGEEEVRRDALKSKWGQLEAVVGTEKRIDLVARDLVAHFEARLETMDGKAMFVSMSRRIAVDLYAAIRRLRPEWHDDDDAKGAIKVVMTGSAADPLAWQPHIRNKSKREELAKRFKDPKDPLRFVIVRDMWLTGFDAPCMHTLYVDKPGGLVVDYLGLADNLRKALATYTESGGTGRTALDQEEAVAVMLEKFEVCRDLFHGFDYAPFLTGTPIQRLSTLPPAQEHILAQQDGKERYVKAVLELGKAFALSVPHEEAVAIRDHVAFFQAVKVALTKSANARGKTEEDLDHAVRQIVSRAVASEGVIDVFAAAGLKKPDISILSDEFLADVHAMPQKNLAVELLRKLLNDEIKSRSKNNLIQSKAFSELLEQAVRRYQNRAIETAQVIEELIKLAKEIRTANERGEKLGLTEDETAFYDALETNASAVAVLGDRILAQIARDLTQTIRANVSIDWTQKETVRAKLRTLVRRLLRKYGYPPDMQAKATETVLAQAELLAADWAG
jgi:type I restriction enzyme R subunit